MTPEPLDSWESELRQDLHRRGDLVTVDVEAALSAVQDRATAKHPRSRARSSLGVIVAAAAVAAIVLLGQVLQSPTPQAPTPIVPSPTALPSGTYRYRLSAHDLRTAGGGLIQERDVIDNVGTWTWTVDHGHWALVLAPRKPDASPAFACSGTVTVDSGVATFVRTVNGNPAGECVPPTWSAHFEIQGNILRWSAVSIPGFSPFFATDPWKRL